MGKVSDFWVMGTSKSARVILILTNTVLAGKKSSGDINDYI